MERTNFSRRQFLKTVGAGAAGLAISGCIGNRKLFSQSENTGRPNIILIMSDDMGFSDLGCYGGEIDTPNLNKLAANGLRFTQFYNTARCCPTRASLLSGLYPSQTGIGHMTEDWGTEGYRGDLNNTCVTIAEVLKSAGYSTYMAGKWHVTRFTAPDGPKHNWPLQRGFDKFYGTIVGAGNYFDPATLTRDNTMITPYNDPEYKPKEFYYTDAITDNAVKYIREHKTDKPFFLYMTYTAAHWPMHAKEKDIAKYRGKYDEGWDPVRQSRYKRCTELGLIDKDWPMSPPDNSGWEKEANKKWESVRMEVYAAMVDCMDQGIGRVLDELKRRGIFENTLIFFLQDNGGCAEELDSRGPIKPDPTKPVEYKPMSKDELMLAGVSIQQLQTRDGRPIRRGMGVMPGPVDTYIAYGKQWANVSNTPFRLYKHWVHEGGISTPLIVHWPAGIKDKGKLRNQTGHLIDIMPTCVEVSGAKYPTDFKGNKIQPMEGKSLAAAFDNKPIERKAIFWEHEGNRAVRMGNWKLVAKGQKGAWELYDMEKDRTELNDLAQQYPNQAEEMSAMYQEWAKRTKVVPKKAAAAK